MELSNYKPNKTKNMTKEETQCLRTLRHIETITIHKADKNNITVVQNKKDYANEGERQLNDGIHYIEIPEINIKNTMNKINEIVYNMNKDNYLDEITFKYIKYENQYITTPFAYFLPKIHKLDNEILKDIYKQQTEIKIQVPARPIISQCNGPLERIGRYLDFFLLPIVKTQTTYISDTGHGDPMDIWYPFDWTLIPQNNPTSEEPVYITPNLIYHLNPNIKLILVIRDPAERHQYPQGFTVLFCVIG
ncbi:unnamed protein product [Mytilus edulis]|uniref:Uncharacterized protein n=1 Tax=Mytilus edulis TaxID=6550 RepID=A0A8S3QMB4_MYTED|nr:unnamed protein product [Mytilus edulis]